MTNNLHIQPVLTAEIGIGIAGEGVQPIESEIEHSVVFTRRGGATSKWRNMQVSGRGGDTYRRA